MSTVTKRPNVKLAKLFYKYMDTKEVKKEEKSADEQKVEKDYESYPPYNFTWFDGNKIAAMGWPQTVENLNYLVDAGINHLITLSPERVPPILEFERKLKWTEIGIKEFGAPTLKQIIKFIEICERAQIREEISSSEKDRLIGKVVNPFLTKADICYYKQHVTIALGRTCETEAPPKLSIEFLKYKDRLATVTFQVIGVHCRHGRGRTGTMLACYLVYFKEMAPERAVMTVRVQRPGSCETYEQEKIVCHYHDCLRGTIEKPDYRLVEDKLYFDYSIKYMFSDQEDRKTVQESEQNEKQETKIVCKDRQVKIKLPKKKSNAMVINHKIYF